MERIKALKQVYDLALGTARSWQNPQTGWIHYCYHLEDEDNHFPIPVYESFLYALALMKSKVGDNVQEAKQLLEKLLHFQTDLFPTYLHEFPKCKDKWIGIQLLPVYAYIFEGFHHVLGENLKQSLRNSMEKMISYSLQQLDEHPPVYHLGVKLGGTLLALGRAFQKEEWKNEGEKLLQKALDSEDKRAWLSPSMMGEMLVGLFLGYPQLKDSPWGPFWKNVCEAWSVRVGAFAGPAWREYQVGYEPQTTLYDLFMAVFSGHFPYRAFVDHPVQLQGVLIPESTEVFPHNEHELWQESWVVQHREKYSLGVMSKTIEVPEAWQKGYIPFKVMWGDLNRYRSLVLQGGNCKTIAYELNEKGVDLIIELDDSQQEKEEKHREICLFTECYPGDQLLVSGNQATTFKLNESVTLHNDDRHFQLTFQQIQGSGEFMGHIMRGNRPSQINTKGKYRTEAFDWMIFIRSVRRSGTCRFVVSFTPD